ncbi:1,4-dihydroxy-2-naphthoate octaprenyltransferase [Boudabousia liubingyangii]|uniref:1,4-dihydroxy-2-naphthoate polyprenyltransferase n=1 Tax=Boudabousia liubingyangii TaxID=1921764 RepID=UPI000939C112|nr:1,4-dihydroxy-2-naphthoate polyprenyltransferase [Boudabousia liubingyangii]OKL46930.1 1,4-dihydroxy-2-naphthoate octaprenyltransferase [Boudabousia liubingyangii]
MKRKVTFNDWLEGARLRTLPAAVAPVFLGTCAAYTLGSGSLLRAFLAALVALGLQVGVNFANDYSDGIRGTDDQRVGPLRLTASGLVPAKTVLRVALGCFGFAGLMGLILLALSGDWWLLIFGILAVIAAWFYTGGKKPYGYLGFGEVMVILCFGFLATQGTLWTQAHAAPWWTWLIAAGVGLLSADLLMINNIRDIPTDRVAGKKTLAVRLGESKARKAYAQILVAAWVLGLIAVLASGPSTAAWYSWNWWGALLFLPSVLGVPLLSLPVVRGKAQGRKLIVTLRNTGLYTLLYSLLLGIGLLLSAL